MLKPSVSRIARRKDDKRRGSVMIESALILIVMLSMILFIMDISRLLFYKEYFTERARVGARWAAVMGTYDAVQIKNVVVYNSTTGSGSGPFGLTTGNVNVYKNTFNSSPVVGSAEQYVTVEIGGFQTITLIPYIAGNFTIPSVIASMPLQCSNPGSGSC